MEKKKHLRGTEVLPEREERLMKYLSTEECPYCNGLEKPVRTETKIIEDISQERSK